MIMTGNKAATQRKADVALEVASEYLKARRDFLSKGPEPLLGGNDNFVGRIGELLAMLYLSQYHGLDLERPRGGESNKSKKAVDLVTHWNTNDETWWSVKAITLENMMGKTSIYKKGAKGFPPLIIVRFDVTNEGIQAECLAYPEGLEREASLSTLNRFAEARPVAGEVELGVFNGAAECPLNSKWKQVGSFDETWARLRKEAAQ